MRWAFYPVDSEEVVLQNVKNLRLIPPVKMHFPERRSDAVFNLTDLDSKVWILHVNDAFLQPVTVFG
jgi:hypothetical protein